MITFDTDYLNRISGQLTTLFISSAPARMRQDISRKKNQAVIRECLKKALAAFISFSRNLPENAGQQLSDLLEIFFSNADVAATLAVLFRGISPDRRDLHHVWNELGGIPVAEAEFDLELALDTFESVFLKSALREKNIKPFIDGEAWQRQTKIPLETLQSIDKLLNILSAVNPDSLSVSGGAMRGIGVGGNVERSVLLTGDNNVVNLYLQEGDEPLTSSTGESPAKLALRNYCERLKKRFSNINLFGRTSTEDTEQATLQRMKTVESGFVALHLTPWQERTVSDSTELEIDPLFLQPAERMLMLVRGLPGSGKTTLMRYLAYRFAGSHLDGAGAWLPVYLRLKHLDLQKTTLVEFVRRQINRDCQDHSQLEHLTHRDCFLDRNMVLLLDGLDEIESSDTRSGFAETLNDFSIDYPRCHILLTSRPVGLKREDFPAFASLDLKPLSAELISSYLKKWFAGKKATKQRRRLASLLQEKSRIGQLAGNPFLLSMICFTFQESGDTALIERRSVLYENCTKILLQRLYDEAEPAPADSKSTYGETIALLKELSLRFFLWQEADFAVEHVNTLGQHILGRSFGQRGEDLLSLVETRSGLIMRTQDGFTFIHRSLWEYFTALALLEKKPDFVIRQAANPDWEEVVRLYAGMLDSDEAVSELVTRLWDINRPLTLRVTTEIAQPAGELLKPLISQSNNQNRLLLIDSLRQSLPLIPSTLRRETVQETLRILLVDCEEKDCQVIYYAQNLLEELEMNPLASGGLIYELLGLEHAEDRQRALLNDPATHFEWIGVKGGEFTMGDDHQEDNEKPAHRVSISGFQMGKHPVTNAMLNHTGHSFPFGQTFPNYGGDSHPAIGNTWWEAYYFALWLGARLPTEAEWEYAARGGKDSRTTAYYFGDDPAELPDHAWFGDSGGKTAHAVDEINPRSGKENLNPLGLANMLGNVREWCRDWYGGGYYQQFEGKTATDPVGPAAGAYRVIRGGGWIFGARDCRVSFRFSIDPAYRVDDIGFRLLRTAK